MNEGHEETIGNALLKLAPAGIGSTIAGLGPEDWQLIASVLTCAYVAIMIVLALPKLIILGHRIARCIWPKDDGSDEAGA